MHVRAPLLLATLALLATGCPPKEEPPTDNFDRNALLASLARHVAVAPLKAFETKANTLATATAALRDVLETEADPSTARTSARNAWKAAIEAWQELEAFQVGPAGLSTATTGGLGLRDRIYSWPVVSNCRVDQVTIENDFSTVGYFDRALVNVGGLAALEYLLFRDDTGNACAPQATINAQGSWTALGAAGITKRRAAYSAAAAANLVEVAHTLSQAWDPAGGDFAGKLANAGKSGSPYPTAKQALDEVFAAMFYADQEIKDAKLGDPAGISTKCTTDTCPDLLESKWAKVSKEHLAANLRGLRRVYLGGEAAEAAANVGFDDFLVALNAAPLATELDGKLVDAIAAVEGIEGTLDDALVNDADGIATAHAAIRAVTDILKSQFVTVLNLSVPQEGAADND